MLKSAFTGGTEFETALAKVGTIADTAAVPLDTLQSQIMEVSNTMGVGAADIAEATYQAISAGQSTGDAVAFAGQASMLAAAGFTSSASAVDILTTALNAYGLGADEAGHVSDVLLTTQNLGKTSVDELSSSMGKVIPLASAYNVSLENLSSGLAIMTANGIATAEATTYTKSMLNELGDTGSAVSKILQSETGQSFAQLMDSGASLGDVLQTLYNSVDGRQHRFCGAVEQRGGGHRRTVACECRRGKVQRRAGPDAGGQQPDRDGLRHDDRHHAAQYGPAADQRPEPGHCAV